MRNKVLKIDIVVNYYSDVIMATIPPIYDENGKLDVAALSEFQEFAINVVSVLDYNEFEPIDMTESDYSETSFYYTAYKRDESTNTNIKCLIFLRISDHNLKSETEKQRKEYYRNKADELKQPPWKQRQKWKFKSIVVNNETYNSYDEALEGLEDILNHL